MSIKSGMDKKDVVHIYSVIFSLVQLLSRVQLFATPWIAAHQASLSITSSRSLPKLMSIESVMPSNHLIVCHPLLLLPPIFPNIRIFSNESDLRIRWPKYWSFSFNISPSNEYSRLSSFRIGWFDLLAGQGTLKSLLQHHSSTVSILQCSAFLMVQLSHPCMTTRKTITLTIWTFVDKLMSLPFNTLPRFVTAFLLRSNYLVISWLQSPSTMILEPKKRKSVTASFHLFPFYFLWSDGTTSWLFHSLLLPSSRGSSVPLLFLPLKWYHLNIWGCWCFSSPS